MALAAGTKLGPYEILAPLGAGGMGEVYRARDTRLNRDVAIKVLPEALANDADRLGRFEQEARTIAALNHPNILGIHDIGTHRGAPFLVSEFLEGQTLREKLESGPLPVRRAIEYGLGIAQGLAAAHEKGIVHRDLKPENVFVTRDGRVKVLDFGLAKLVTPEKSHETVVTLMSPATLPGMVMGTVGYMSPEQVRGEPSDARSDIFSFGAVLYEMLTGKRAFKRATSAETMTAILREEPPELSDTGWQGPLALQRIVARCLEKSVERRFQSASDLAFAIESLSGISTTKSVPQPKSSRAWLPWVVAAALVMGTAVWEMSRPAAPPPNPLEKARFTRVTDFESVEAAISPDGRFVAFVSDHDGPFDVWLTQVGTGRMINLTQGNAGPLPGPLRNVGFSGDGSEIWIGGGDVGMRLRLMPLTGGAPRNFLGEKAANPAWSPDGERIVYHNFTNGDPMFVADRTGANALKIFGDQPALHNHFPTWSPDGRWIYFVHGTPATSRARPRRTRCVWRGWPMPSSASSTTWRRCKAGAPILGTCSTTPRCASRRWRRRRLRAFRT